MRKPLVLLLPVAVLAALPAAAAERLTLKRVVLSTGGVAYFEHEATVDGRAELLLDVRLDQVDDVLKSLVLLDDKGGVGALSLPGRQPLAEAFRDLPFGQEALASPVDLLNALQGAEVQASGPKNVAGRIVRVLPETVQVGEATAERHRVSVLTAEGLKTFILEEADAVRFADLELDRQVQAALAAVAQHRVQDRRSLTLVADGQGRRTVRVGYVVAAPLWKVAYRLTLGKAQDKGRLQGWAVLENMSGTDWQGVELTLLSGNPVTFRQQLYQAYNVERPEVPVEVLGRVLPSPDEGTLALRGFAAAPPPPPAAPMQERPRTRAMLSDQAAGAAKAEATAAAPAFAPAAVAAESEEATTQVRFRYPRPVSVRAGESLSLPVVDRDVPAGELALYQPGVAGRNPLAAVQLKNDAESGLPPGVLTLYSRSGQGEVAYLGDARVAPLPQGEERLLSFAVDGKTLVDTEEGRTRRIAGGSVANGVFRMTSVERVTTAYTVKAPAGEARRVALEHPRRPGWNLVEPSAANVEATQSRYRLPLELKAGETRKLAVTLERPIVEQYRLLDLAQPQVLTWAGADGLPAPVREAFQRLAELRGALDGRRQTVAELEQQRRSIGEDQARIRENLARVPRESELHRRYMEKLTQQEGELDRIGENEAAARETLAAAEKALNDFVAGLEL